MKSDREVSKGNMFIRDEIELKLSGNVKLEVDDNTHSTEIACHTSSAQSNDTFFRSNVDFSN